MLVAKSLIMLPLIASSHINQKQKNQLTKHKVIKSSFSLETSDGPILNLMTDQLSIWAVLFEAPRVTNGFLNHGGDATLFSVMPGT